MMSLCTTGMGPPLLPSSPSAQLVDKAVLAGGEVCAAGTQGAAASLPVPQPDLAVPMSHVFATGTKSLSGFRATGTSCAGAAAVQEPAQGPTNELLWTCCFFPDSLLFL